MESEAISTNSEEKPIESNSDDPFAYLNRQFSNEQFKIVLRNLPAYYGISVRIISIIPKIKLI